MANVLKPMRGQYIMVCERPVFSHLLGANEFCNIQSITAVRGQGSLVH